MAWLLSKLLVVWTLRASISISWSCLLSQWPSSTRLGAVLLAGLAAGQGLDVGGRDDELRYVLRAAEPLRQERSAKRCLLVYGMDNPVLALAARFGVNGADVMAHGMP
jgi:hypothetical protein